MVITDIRMPPTNTTEGIELAHEVRDVLPGCGVVVLSQHDDEEYIWSLFEDGVAGYAYLHKLRVSDAEQLVRAVQEVAIGGSVLDPAIVQRLLALVRASPASPLDDLTEGEAERAPADGRGIQQRGHRGRDAPGHRHRGEAHRSRVPEAGADRP